MEVKFTIVLLMFSIESIGNTANTIVERNTVTVNVSFVMALTVCSVPLRTLRQTGETVIHNGLGSHYIRLLYTALAI